MTMKSKRKAVATFKAVAGNSSEIISDPQQFPSLVHGVAASMNVATDARNRDFVKIGSSIYKEHILAEGGSSICRDEDPPPLLLPVLGDNPLLPAVSLSLPKDALKVSDECPSREIPSVQPRSSCPLSGPGPDVLIGSSHDPAAAPRIDNMQQPNRFENLQQPSYAAVLTKPKGPEMSFNSRSAAAVPSVHCAGPKPPLIRSFHDDGRTNSFGQIIEIEGRKIMAFSEEEIEELAAPFQFTLVGKFSHGFPSMKILKSIMGNLNLKRSFSVSLLDRRHVLIRLSCEEDYTRLWSRQVWFMAGFPMRVLKWTPNFDPLVEAPFAPVWVLFPYLPVHLFDQRSLFEIASALGKPLRMDSATAELTRASTARVCIEIDVTKARLSEVELRLGGKIKMQEVEYENVPSYCSFCKHLGHDLKDCKSFPSASVVGETSLVRPLQEVSDPAQAIPKGTSGHKTNVLKDDMIVLDSKGMLSLPPGRNDPLIKPVNAPKIRADILQSYDRFDNVEDLDLDNGRFSIQNNSHNEMSDAFNAKNYYSEGDSNSDSAPIILPPKKKVKKKSKNNSDISKHVEERVELQITGLIEAAEGFIEVASKNNKKKSKEKKNPG